METVKIPGMSRKPTKTKIDGEGLRYQAKVSGSPFNAISKFSGSTMSCYLCGKHRARAALMTRKLIGKTQLVCSPSCKAQLELQEGRADAPPPP